MKKLRIAFCLRDMQMGGVESVLIRTLDKLMKHKNIELSVITYVDIKTRVYREYFKKHPQIKLCSLYPCKWLGTDLPHFFVWRLMILAARKIYRETKRIFVLNKFKDFDVLIDYHDFGFHDELKYIHGVKKIAWFHSSVNVFAKRRFIDYIPYYDNLVVLTDACLCDLSNMYPKHKAKMVRIYNLVDVENITKLANEKRKIREKYFCCVSRLSGDKDIKTLMDAFDVFESKNKGVKLVVVGDGDKAKEYKNYANTLKSGKQIIFVGAQRNPFEYMRYALANVLSSYGEGLPTVLVESMIVGTVNIASDCKYGPREILLDGRAGLLFEPGNVEQLAQCMNDVYNEKVDVKHMAANATKSLNRFDSDKIVDEIISLIS